MMEGATETDRHRDTERIAFAPNGSSDSQLSKEAEIFNVCEDIRN